MRQAHRTGIGLLLAAAMFTSGCYGPFLLTRKVWKWNGEVSDNKWVVEVVYLVCTWLPVYGVAGLADAVIFNSVEFWTGKNPMANADASGVPATKRIVRNDSEATLTRISTPEGEQLLIEQVEHGKPGASLRLQRQGDSTRAYDANGVLLYGATTHDDGSVAITDARGKQIAMYSGDQVDRLLKSTHR